MPKTAGISAYGRYTIIDRCFRTGEKFSKKSLLQCINQELLYLGKKAFSESMLRVDLRNMIVHFNAPINADGKNGNQKLYYYTNPNFSISQLPPLSDNDFEYLQQAINLLRNVRGWALAPELEMITKKLQYELLPDAKTPVIIFSGPEYFEGMNLLDDLYLAIVKKQVIKFLYQPFGAAVAGEIILHPFLLKEYNSRWFLIGYDEAIKSIRVCGLDRIKSDPKYVNRCYITPGEIGFEPIAYFKDVIGLTVDKDQAVMDVELKVNSARAPYIMTKPLHNSQRPIKSFKNGSILVGYSLRINKELISTILSFGKDVHVIKPEKLKEIIKKEIEKMRLSYK